MSQDYQATQVTLEQNELFIMPSEVHGVITGLLACGVDIEDKEYLTILSDVFNDGIAFSGDLKKLLVGFYSQIRSTLDNRELQFELYLPDEDESLHDRANALVAWVSGFLLGFGLKQKDYGRLSAEVKEVIHDFTEINQMDTTFDETEEDKQAFHEVVEYVRISVHLCFAELGKSEHQNAAINTTIH
ncbi:UPF0149 family protein [Pseudoalteromonas piratica]|uniref:Putative exported protein n=1 Tax=Pseudoalteromonas piratica TaxID=1348114 RepID=A0A0A7EH25_9GAMM|nr:UPF0149 family protein [Pseudoalteromonas piratica]AIY65965.1 putative exported protein precursor [Pseudoalteromonas piratica]